MGTPGGNSACDPIPRSTSSSSPSSTSFTFTFLPACCNALSRAATSNSKNPAPWPHHRPIQRPLTRAPCAFGGCATPQAPQRHADLRLQSQACTLCQPSVSHCRGPRRLGGGGGALLCCGKTPIKASNFPDTSQRTTFQFSAPAALALPSGPCWAPGVIVGASATNACSVPLSTMTCRPPPSFAQ
jgi:hypothetical protein